MEMYNCSVRQQPCENIASGRTHRSVLACRSRTRTAMTSTSAAIAAASVVPCGSPSATDTAAKFTLPPTYEAQSAAATCAAQLFRRLCAVHAAFVLLAVREAILTCLVPLNTQPWPQHSVAEQGANNRADCADHEGDGRLPSFRPKAAAHRWAAFISACAGQSGRCSMARSCCGSAGAPRHVRLEQTQSAGQRYHHIKDRVIGGTADWQQAGCRCGHAEQHCKDRRGQKAASG